MLIRGGRVVDGTGLPSFTADVEVRDGRITRVGRSEGTAGPDTEVVDADGLVVAPGFVDIHTHYDAQVLFEPTLSPSSWHGVTTVAVGNCGFTLAPSRPEDRSWLLRLLARVEGMPVAALETGVDFAGGSLAEYFDRLEGRIGVNVASYVGHNAVRRAVMGVEASEREADAAEIDAMATLVRQAMREGAIGFSSSQLDIHADDEGKPVPSNIASADELVALAGVLAEFESPVIEIAPHSSLPGYTDADRELLRRMAAASGATVHVNIVDRFPGFQDGWQRNLAVAEEARADGLRIHPMFRANTQGFLFCLADTFLFDDLPRFRAALADPEQLRDPVVRAEIDHELETTPNRTIAFEWDMVRVAGTDEAMTGLDDLLDRALADDMGTLFELDRSPGPGHRELQERLARHPLLTAGASDGGAHLSSFCGADYPTRMLTELVPDPLTLEEAVRKLTFEPASLLGLWDRGCVRPGFAADLVLFDPDRLAVGPPHFVTDFPAGGQRIVRDAEGYEAVLTNGRPVADLTGTVLRRG